MYLYYYCNEKYVGQVDIEVFFGFQQKKSLITCTPESEDLLSALELMYGKRIERFTTKEAWKIRHGGADHTGKVASWPAHLFTTKKCGPVLKWGDSETRTLCV